MSIFGDMPYVIDAGPGWNILWGPRMNIPGLAEALMRDEIASEPDMEIIQQLISRGRADPP